jgi:hypothetical protein
MLSLGRGGDRLPGSGEGDEERVALRVHLPTRVRVERGPEQSAVVVEDGAVPRAGLLEQTGGALDVGEEEGDCSDRERRAWRRTRAGR